MVKIYTKNYLHYLHQSFSFFCTEIDDDLRYADDNWDDQTRRQDDQGEVEVFHCKWLNFLLLVFLFEENFIYQ